MGGIRQMQRRAIETLRNVIRDEAPVPIERGILFLSENQQPLFPLGISPGVGTCSDIHGMNVLVLSEYEPINEWSIDNQSVCEYAVLLRKPTEAEWRENGCPTLCVERLRILDITSSGVVLSKTGINQLYAKI